MSSITLSMIVRDAEAWLPACLESVRGVVDHMAIADTGSTDKTVEVARRFGAAVFVIPWTNDFAEARNRALASVNSEWVLSLDADEQLDPAASSQIPLLLASPSCDAYQVTIRNYVLSMNDRIWDRPATRNDSLLEFAKPYPAYVDHENVRLFRRHPDIYFIGRVHESVGTRIVQTGRNLGHANFLIHHFGLAADQETRQRKNLLYRELGRRKIQEMPRDAQAHLELGLVELDNFGDLREALSLFERARNLNPRLAQAWFFEGITLLKLDRPLEALHSLRRAERAGLRSALVSETLGDAHYNLARFEKAFERYSFALKQDPENPGLLSKSGLALLRSGEAEAGLQRLREAIRTKPAFCELHDRLILGCVALGRMRDAAEAAQSKLDAVLRPESTDFLRAASLWMKANDCFRATAAVRGGLALFPENEKLLMALGELESAGGAPILEVGSKYLK